MKVMTKITHKKFGSKIKVGVSLSPLSEINEGKKEAPSAVLFKKKAILDIISIKDKVVQETSKKIRRTLSLVLFNRVVYS